MLVDSARPLTDDATDRWVRRRRQIRRLVSPLRYWHGVRRRYVLAQYRGDAVTCPCCGTRLRAFAPDRNRANAICPRCGSHERHRALALYFGCREDLWGPGRRVLHFAPEYALEGRLRARRDIEYVTADLEPGVADCALDITRMALPDNSFDVIICSHILEHVEDDRTALRELLRVLKPRGEAIVLVPIDHRCDDTYEDPAIVAPDDRRREYWQHDHVRLYGNDFAARLREAGFEVDVVVVKDHLDQQLIERYGLLADEELFVCAPDLGHVSGTRSQDPIPGSPPS